MKPTVMITHPHKRLTFRTKESALFVAVKLAVMTMGQDKVDRPIQVGLDNGALVLRKGQKYIACAGPDK